MNSDYRKAYLRKWEEENREHRSAYKKKRYQDHKAKRKLWSIIILRKRNDLVF